MVFFVIGDCENFAGICSSNRNVSVQMIRCQAYGSRPRTQRIILEDGSHSSVTGKLFNETVNVRFPPQTMLNNAVQWSELEFYVLQILVHLNNRCLPDVLNDIVVHGAHDPEEFPFLEELHVLRRLQVRHLVVCCISTFY